MCTTTPFYKKLAQHIKVPLVATILLAGTGLVSGQTPSQLPLLTKSGPAVQPNIMLIMDDSGSMTWRHMPEDVFAGDTFSTSNSVGSNGVRWDPSDGYQWTVNTAGTVPGDIASTNYRLRGLRSPDTNTMYYNPEIRYQPWLSNDGTTRLPNSPVTAAYLSPPLIRGASVTALTVATGSKLLTLTQTGLSFTTGSTVLIASATSPATQWMYGTISAFNATTGSMTVNVANTLGSGTGLNWTVVQTPNGIVDLTKISPNGTFTAGSFLVGQTYTIVTKGTTSFTAIGAANNNAGTVFTATGAGSGTGTASAGTNSGWCFANATTSCTNSTGPFNHDPGVYFRLTKTNGIYNSITDYTKYTAFTINAAVGTTYTKYTGRDDCAGVSCTRDEERQNFANWYTYYRTRNLMARGSMMEAFGPVSNTFRLGFGRINKGSATVDGVNNTTVIESSSTYGGGGVRAYDSARRVNLFKWLEDLPANGSTPLVEALDAAGKYYSRTDNRGPWTDDPSTTNTVSSNKTCRRSYTILTTDGYWNGPGVNVGNADATNGTTITGNGSYTYIATRPYSDGTANTLADVAMYYWKRDLQTGMDNKVPPIGTNNSFWQNMTDFTVGLGVRGSLNPATDLPALTSGAKSWPAAGANQTFANVDDLWHAAVNSRGQYFSAKDPKELSDAVKTALASAAGKEGRTAGAATAATTLSSDNRKYVPIYTPGSWDGDIEASALDAVGQTTAVQWRAASRMPAAGARNIVTWDSTSNTAVNFTWAALSSSAKSELGTVATTYTTDFINFLRGDHSQEGDGKPFRSRINSTGAAFVLGDFINANPVLVKDGFDGVYSSLGLGNGNSGNPTYTQFLTYKASRTSVLYVGSNDGMLHAFKDTKGVTPSTDGQEVFAYVPRAVYPNLYKLTDKSYGAAGTLEHQYFVDGPLDEADAYIPAPGAGSASWRNILVGSLGAGGRAVFGLDVTDPNSLGTSTVRWEISSSQDADLGYVMAPIRVGVLPNGRWVAIFGNGFSSTNGKASLFIVDLALAGSGSAGAIKKVDLDVSGSNGLGGVTLIHDTSGQITNIYVGDLKGRLWKLNYSSAATNWFVVDGGAALFAATDSSGTAQPIISNPAVYNHALGGKIVIFGTGRLFTDTDQSTTSAQSVYAVWDKPSDSVTHPIGRSFLSARTLSSFTGTNNATFYAIAGTAVDWTSQRGWYLDVSGVMPGARVLYPVQVLGYDTVLITAVAPVQGTPVACDSQFGTGMSLILPVQSGLNSPNHTLDTNGDGVINGSDTYAVGYKTEAGGVSAIVRSAPGAGSSGGCSGVSTNCGGSDPNNPNSGPGYVGTGTNDKGGGGEVGDCTGAVCGAVGNTCQPSPLCTEANTCLDSIQSAKSGMVVCVDTGTPPPGNPNPVTVTRQYDRVWRRIINPPIR